ncbi:hypothetical protein P8452_70955 [Trifolium repens]|nr:hypothetical protein P8452_70955 [Trifolium repens]
MNRLRYLDDLNSKDQKMNQEINSTTQGVMNPASQGVNGQGDHVMGPPNQPLPTQHLNDEAGPSTQAIGPELANTQESKKRKPNANDTCVTLGFTLENTSPVMYIGWILHGFNEKMEEFKLERICSACDRMMLMLLHNANVIA